MSLNKPILPLTIEDLLSPEEQAELKADLVEMARCRRRVEAVSRDIPLGGTS